VNIVQPTTPCGKRQQGMVRFSLENSASKGTTKQNKQRIEYTVV
jgi:hypothetical protein